MAALTGNLISDSYQGLLKTVDNGPITSTLKNITDGDGNSTVVSLSTTTASISGALIVTGTLSATASNAVSSSYALTSNLAVTASTANLLNGQSSFTFATTGSNVFLGTQAVTGAINLEGSLVLSQTGSMLVIPTTTAAIPTVGSIYFDAFSNTLYVYNGSSYVGTLLS